MMEYYFSGTIERIIFENPSSFFRILLLDISDTDAENFNDFEIIVTGTMADIMEGEDYTFWGELVHHPKYGEQLKISRYERAKPSSKGLVKYFSSDHFKGIGLKTAQKIVDLYGDDTIDKILEYLNAALMIEPKGIYYYFMAYIKYDYFERKHFRTSPNYVDALQMANEAGLSDFDIEQLYTILNVARPDCI